MMNYFFSTFAVWKSEGEVTSGVSRSIGDLIEVCIMLATKMCLAVASGSTEYGVP